MRDESSVWQNNGSLVILRGSELPYKCVKTNNAAVRRVSVQLLSDEEIASLVLFLGPRLLFSFLWPLNRITIEAPLSQAILAKSEAHRNIGKWMAFIGFPLFAIAWMCMAIGAPWGEDRDAVFGFLALLLMAGLLVGGFGLLLVWQSRKYGLEAPKITKSYAWIKGVHKDYLSSLPVWPGEG